MHRKFLTLISAAAATLALASCGMNSSVSVLPKSAIKSGGATSWAFNSKVSSFPTSSPSATVMSAAGTHRKDKHGMPVYAYSERTRLVRTTAYTCSESDHIVYGDKNATGTQLRYTDRVRSAAADWSFYPVGTVFRIKGLPYLYVVDDYGSALTGTGTIDIYKPSKDVMNVWGRRNVEITVVQWGSFPRSAEILAQRGSYWHCRQMLANITRQRPDLATASR